MSKNLHEFIGYALSITVQSKSLKVFFLGGYFDIKGSKTFTIFEI